MKGGNNSVVCVLCLHTMCSANRHADSLYRMQDEISAHVLQAASYSALLLLNLDRPLATALALSSLLSVEMMCLKAGRTVHSKEVNRGVPFNFDQ